MQLDLVSATVIVSQQSPNILPLDGLAILAADEQKRGCRLLIEVHPVIMQRPPVSTSEYPDFKRVSLVSSLGVSS